MRGRDAACERCGSLLHFLFQPTPMEPRRHVSRLFIRESGIGADPTETLVADEVASHLCWDLGQDAHCRRKKQKRTRTVAALDPPENEALRKNLRRAPHLAIRSEETCPTLLKPDAEKAVRNAMSQAHNLERGQIAPLPHFPEDVRTMRRDRTVSVLRQGLQAWLSSEPAEEWRNQRQHLFDPGVSAGSAPREA